MLKKDPISSYFTFHLIFGFAIVRGHVGLSDLFFSRLSLYFLFSDFCEVI